MYVQNPTPLVAEAFCTTDARGAETAVVVVKGTWEPDDARTPARPGHSLRLAPDQRPITAAPVYRSEPGASSLLWDTDLVPTKPGTDCLLRGHAYGGGLREVDVWFAVLSDGRPIAEARAVVFGPRQWQTTLGLAATVGPLPFETTELVWEQAFGGADRTPDDPALHDELAENPVGTGLRAPKSRRPVDGAPLPAIERSADRLAGPNGGPRPVGFGPVAPSWEPRRSYAGTYDEVWRRTRAPLPPDDFDARFYQSAPSELVATPHLRGDEEVVVEGCGPRPWRFRLPDVRVRAALLAGWRAENQDAVLDTVLVDADARTVETVWRSAFDVHGRVDRVEGARVWAGRP